MAEPAKGGDDPHQPGGSLGETVFNLIRSGLSVNSSQGGNSRRSKQADDDNDDDAFVEHPAQDPPTCSIPQPDKANGEKEDVTDSRFSEGVSEGSTRRSRVIDQESGYSYGPSVLTFSQDVDIVPQSSPPVEEITPPSSINVMETKPSLGRISMKYDLDGDNILDENERKLREMDDGNGINLHQVYKKMNELSLFKKKYANAKFAIIMLLLFGGFILGANLAMSIVAVRHYKDTKVKNNIMTTNDKEATILATKGLGSTGSTIANDDDDAMFGGSSLGRVQNRDSAKGYLEDEACNVEEFDRILSFEYLQGALSSNTCQNLYSDAENGSRHIIVQFKNRRNGMSDSISIDNFHRVARFDEELCSIFIFIGDSATWYFRDCDSKCRFFITPNYQIPLPNCLFHSGQRNLSIGSRCDHDKECQSGLCRYKVSPSHVYFWEGPRAASETYNEHLSNLYTDSATKICVGFVPFKNPGTLQQSAFNGEGPLLEITPNLYNEFYRAAQLISSIQKTIGDRASGDVSYAYHRALAVEANDPLYRTKFIKETGCIFFYEGHPDLRGRCVHASEIENNKKYGVNSPEYKTAKSLDMGVVEKYGNVCYGIFRGTASVDKSEWIMDNDHKRVETITTDRGTCHVNNGFARAFWEESGLWANLGMEHHLRECANDCVATTGKKCDVVLGGHSHGGGLAAIAAIHLQDLDPVVISSAGVSGIYPGPDGKLCPNLNKDRIFQFVAAIDPTTLIFDPVPFISEAYTVQIGHQLRPTGEGSSSVSYYYPTPPPIYGNLFAGDFNYFVETIHNMVNFYHPQLFQKMKDYIDSTGNPSIQLGFKNDMACGHSDECYSIRCARSTLNPFYGRTCQTPLENNVEGCYFNIDCKSGRCDDRFCYTKEENGSACNEDSDCLSSRCESKTCVVDTRTKPPTRAPSSRPSSTHPSVAPSLSSQPSTVPSLSSQPSCSIYEEEADLEGCGPSNTGGASMTPLSGSYLGGTVIKIQNLKYCLLDPKVEVFCRFEGNGFDEVTKGIRLSKSSLECITPFAGLPSSVVKVKYAANQEGCTFSKDWADWGNTNDYFMYNEDQGSVKVRGNVKVNKTEVYAVVPNIVSLDKLFNVEWNAEALLLEAYASLSRTTTVSEDDLMIDVEILIRDEDAAISSRTEPTFQSIQKNTMPSTAMSTTDLTITNDEIMSYLTSNWGVIGELSASFVIRVVAYTYNNEGLRWIGGTRTSQLVGVVHPGGGAGGSCTLTSMSTCKKPEVLACPPTRAILLNDVAFEEDEICVWPSGNNECDPDYEINFDLQSTCIATSDDLPIHGKYCDGESTSMTTDESSLNGCSCNVFHREATGCYRSGQTQCCYSEEGALLNTPENDGGSFDCYPGDNRNFLDAMKHYLYDVLPYLYCCDELQEDCESYYKERPVINVTNYEIPSAPAYAFGDPHLVSWHGNGFGFPGIGEHVAVCGQVDEGNSVKPVEELLVDCKPDVSRILESRNVFSVNYVFAQQNPDDAATITTRVGIEDPTFEEGAFIVIEPQSTNNTMLDVYVGSTLVDFQNTVRKSYGWGGIRRSDDFSQMTITVRRGGPENRKVIVHANNGVLSVEVGLNNRLKHGRIIGLLGRSQQQDMALNEYVSSNGVELAGDRTDQTNIYNNFGTTWKVTTGDSSSHYSLFRQAPTTSRRLQEVDSSYEPVFEILPMTSALKAKADEVCAGIENAFINYTCYFDISVTKQPDLIATTTAEALKEERETIIVLNDTVPVITPDPNQFAWVYLNEYKSFSFNIIDFDVNTTLNSTVNHNDDGLFEYIPLTSRGYFKIIFKGSGVRGRYKMKITFTDGIAPVICTVVVHVEDALRSWQGDPFLNLGPGEHVAACGELDSGMHVSKTNEELLEICSPSVSRNPRDRNAFSIHYDFGEDVGGSSHKIKRVGIEDFTLNGQFIVIQPNKYEKSHLDVFLGHIDVFNDVFGRTYIYTNSSGAEIYEDNWGSVERSSGKNEVTIRLLHKNLPGFDTFDISVTSFPGGMLVPMLMFRDRNYDMIGLLGRACKDSSPPTSGFVNSNGDVIEVEDSTILYDFFGSTWKINHDTSSDFSLFSQVES